MESFNNLVVNNGATMAGRCTCCHVCHTSLKTSRRHFAPCTTCPTIICQPCIEFTGDNWEEIVVNPTWSCPRCRGDCPCKRCKNKVSGGLRTSGDSFPRLVTIEKPRRKAKRKRTASRSPELSARVKARRPSPDRSRRELEDDSDIVPPGTTGEMRKLALLRHKNEQCIEYITRTEALLNLIRSEQLSIHTQLEAITANLESSSEASSPDSTDECDVEMAPSEPSPRGLQSMSTDSIGLDESVSFTSPQPQMIAV
mmetsp:Transcript_13524/g.53618  ORF Transcript_13524/g.53618 Transcript_13524/m.53618 type:complete len:255 (+) Transcript_13524:145-909(+)|eukprot:CAMPEP_0114627158 /NCGR_PEP_ID=MMETSP0168-20121206/12153_1 /TAXON_ID=95228 ORGANISM="Vannella sp., Strain DIVA3 517/6/12" /NCGR_SAMPLE_ID=MMETSP0168 /ASSEMBLY_ACC=CAM_ASM_000044 /LENGTH=254 /DNA_ID=CAMNT_0001838485 /DNA_START=116 /DNA_END=880 /DNA_ORIENTATION=+